MKLIYDCIIEFFAEFGDPKLSVLGRISRMMTDLFLLGLISVFIYSTAMLGYVSWPWGPGIVIGVIIFFGGWLRLGRWAFEIKKGK